MWRLRLLERGWSGGPSGYACPAPCGPVSLAQGQMNPWPITVASGRVYWVDHTDAFDGVVRGVSTAGGSVTNIAQAPSVRGLGASSMTADDKSVYWTSGAGNSTNVVVSAPVQGGKAATLYSDPGTSFPNVSAIEAANGVLYAQSSQGLVQIPRDGGAAIVIDAKAQCYGQIAVDGQSLFCVGDGVTSYPVGGSTATTLVSDAALGQEHVAAIGIQGGQMYLAGYSSSSEMASLYVMPESGGTPMRLATGLQMKSIWFVVNDAGLFWVAGTPGGQSYPLMELGLSGGTPKVANQRGAANFIAADAHGVYLPDYSGDIDEYVF